ncbi:hypothetical protein SEA_FAUST_218 [Streptomyces phage Faust]|uniref:Uncharacterized protein n=1 Tax=Streptomyces phage Faust TaxID=2767565 RepID=A0A7G9UZ35_9CAUD|nr:hypothetical protein PP456_gp069 [Streptomyces phage Faust]QNN99290.1 hypothetical protein SEA_FAUST_218 [Streptomyces phage Faust]
MPTVYDYNDETDVPEIEADSPDDVVFVLDGLFDFVIR